MNTRDGGQAAPRAGLPILHRTFLLMLAALLVAQAIAVALVVYAPVRPGAVELMRVVALLSSRMPSTDSALHVSTVDAAPVIPADGALQADARIQRAIARWLDKPREVRHDTGAASTHVRQRPSCRRSIRWAWP